MSSAAAAKAPVNLPLDPGFMSRDAQIVLMQLVSNIDEMPGAGGVPIFQYLKVDDLVSLNALYGGGINVPNAIVELESKGFAKRKGDVVELSFTNTELSIIRYFHNLIETSAKGKSLSFDPVQLSVEFYGSVFGRKIQDVEKNAVKQDFNRSMNRLVEKRLMRKLANPSGTGHLYEINKEFIGYTSPLVNMRWHFDRAWLEFTRESKFLRKVAVHDIFLMIDGKRTNGMWRFDFDELAYLVKNAPGQEWHGWKIAKVDGRGEPTQLELRVKGKWKLQGFKRDGSPSLHIYLVEDEKKAIDISLLVGVAGELKNELQNMNKAAKQDIFSFGEGDEATSILDARMLRIHYNLDFVLPSGKLKQFILTEVGGMTSFRSHHNNYTVRFYPLIKNLGGGWSKLTPSVAKALIQPSKTTVKGEKPGEKDGGGGGKPGEKGEKPEEKEVTTEMRNEIEVFASDESDERSGITLGQIIIAGGGGIKDPVLCTVHGFMTRASHVIESQVYQETHFHKTEKSLERINKEVERFEKNMEVQTNYIIAYTELVDRHFNEISVAITPINEKLDNMDQTLNNKFGAVTSALDSASTELTLGLYRIGKRIKKSDQKIRGVVNKTFVNILDDISTRMDDINNDIREEVLYAVDSKGDQVVGLVQSAQKEIESLREDLQNQAGMSVELSNNIFEITSLSRKLENSFEFMRKAMQVYQNNNNQILKQQNALLMNHNETNQRSNNFRGISALETDFLFIKGDLLKKYEKYDMHLLKAKLDRIWKRIKGLNPDNQEIHSEIRELEEVLIELADKIKVKKGKLFGMFGKIEITDD